MIAFAGFASDEAASANCSVEVGSVVAGTLAVHSQSRSLDTFGASVLKIVHTVSAACMAWDTSSCRIHHSGSRTAALASKRSSERGERFAGSALRSQRSELAGLTGVMAAEADTFTVHVFIDAVALAGELVG